MKKILLSCIILFGGVTAFAQTKIDAKDAAKHLNEKVTICDKVYGGKFLENAKLTLIDMGGNHPNEALTIVIKGDDRKKFKNAPEVAFKGKYVCVTGTVIDFKGKPEIVVTEADQIKEQM